MMWASPGIQSSSGVCWEMKYLGIAAAIVLLLSQVQAKPESCSQTPSMAGMEQDTASCMAFMPAWTYDASKNACSEFIYGGCGGNSNQFSSQNECEKACKD